MKESNLSQLLNRRLALLSERANLSLLELCHTQMRECIESMDRELLSPQNRHLPPLAKGNSTVSNPNL